MNTEKRFLLSDNLPELLKLIPMGTVKRVVAGGTPVCLVNLKGELIGFKDHCPHMNHPLSQGIMNNFEEIICPLHAYRFHLRYGNEANNKCGSLSFIEVQEENGKIYLVI